MEIAEKRDAGQVPSDAVVSDHELETLSSWLRGARLESAAVFLLEAHRPLMGIANAGLAFLAPIARPVVGPHRWDLLERLTRDQSAMDRLLRRL